MEENLISIKKNGNIAQVNLQSWQNGSNRPYLLYYYMTRGNVN